MGASKRVQNVRGRARKLSRKIDAALREDVPYQDRIIALARARGGVTFQECVDHFPNIRPGTISCAISRFLRPVGARLVGKSAVVVHGVKDADK